ncbi:MAG: ABC transporter substrate-binding protein [Candidatus Latescibacteria bacterium]|nr:ABC transporter substrate-binding protein [Candidatus Latescibacterota bacterium]
MTKLLNLIIIVLALVLVFIIVYPQWQENRPIDMRIGCDSTVNSNIFIITQSRGFFQQEKINTQFVFYQDPTMMLSDLAADKIDCAVCPWPTLLKWAVASEDSFKAITSVEYRTSIPIDAIFAKPAVRNPITQMRDLKNKRLGYPTQLKDVMPVVISGMGFKENEIRLVDLSNGSLITALNDNQVDAIIVLEPERTAALNQGLVSVSDPALPKLVIAPYPGAAVIVKNDFIVNKRRAAFKFKMVLDASVAYADANVEDSRRMFLSFFNLDQDIYGNCYLPQNQKLLEINKGAIISMMAKMFEVGAITNTFDVQALFPLPAQFRQ